MEKIDLHIHTNLSDGDYDIKDIIQYSKVKNCFKIAITDHEVIRDYQDIGIKENINIINGIEFNSSEKGLHILGYGIEDIDNMSKYVNNLHQENEWITFELINKLEEKGIDISIEKLIKYLRQNNLIYTYLDKRHVVKYLISKEYAKDVYDTYKRLIGRGTELYIPLKKISSNEIIDKINVCGGVSVLAHPFTLDVDRMELFKKIKELKSYGLDGIEIMSSQIPTELSAEYNRIADEIHIIKTVGSDFHNFNSNGIGIECNEEIFCNLNDKIKSKKIYKEN